MYWGCKRLLAVTPTGVITGCVAGPASPEQRWLAEARRQRRVTALALPWVGTPPTAVRPVTGKPYGGPNGPVWPRLGVGHRAAQGAYAADRNDTGMEWQGYGQTGYGAAVVTPAAFPPAETAAQQAHASLRQIVETGNSQPNGDCGLEYLQARSRWGCGRGWRPLISASCSSSGWGVPCSRLRPS